MLSYSGRDTASPIRGFRRRFAHELAVLDKTAERVYGEREHALALSGESAAQRSALAELREHLDVFDAAKDAAAHLALRTKLSDEEIAALRRWPASINFLYRSLQEAASGDKAVQNADLQKECKNAADSIMQSGMLLSLDDRNKLPAQIEKLITELSDQTELFPSPSKGGGRGPMVS